MCHFPDVNQSFAGVVLVAAVVLMLGLAHSASIGGIATLIGTPPNIVISQFRESELGAAYNMFDFAPVGLGAALAGLAFIALAGWRLVPAERSKRNAARSKWAAIRLRTALA